MPSEVLNARSTAQSGFGSARSGSVNILFALSLLPIIGLIGLAVDYGVALADKAKLDNAADAAVLAAVATAKAYIATYSGTQTDPTLTKNAIAAGIDRGTRAFAGNAGSLPFAATPTAVPVLTRSGQTFTATISYQTSSTNNFGQIFGQNMTTIGGSTGARADVPSYIDFYLLIDVSGSMGLPATTDGQSALIAHTPSSCQFVCHFPGNDGSVPNSTGWNYAANNNIQLRSGAVNTAVCSLLALAAKPLVPKQYRVGLYPFITRMGTLANITSDIASLQTVATCSSSSPTAFTQLLDTGTTQLAINNDPSTGTGSGGTHLTDIFTSVQSTITTFGDGSSAKNPKPFVFLITDGMNNSQYRGVQKSGTWYYPGNPSSYYGYGNSDWYGGSNPQTLSSSFCNSIKNAGANLSVLTIPYSLLTVGPNDADETRATNKVSPNVPAAMSNCASTGFFTTANTPADINTALQAMFAQAIQSAHLTN